MAINSQIDYSIGENAFKAYVLGKVTGSTDSLKNTLNKDNLVVREMAKNVYHFSQTKADIVPRLMSPLDQSLSASDLFIYKRHSHMKWEPKIVANATTPYQTREVDQRGVAPQILHTAIVEDVDYKRKTPVEITAATQMEFMWSLSRAKERLAQFGASQDVLSFTETVVAGYEFDNSPSTVSFPDSSLMTIPSGTAPSGTNDRLASVDTGTVTTGDPNAKDKWVDDLVDYIYSLNQSPMDVMLICHHSVRRHIKRIISYRDRENTMVMEGNENAQVFKYKDLTWVFLLKDAYLNQREKFESKYHNVDGKVRSTAATGYIQFPADLDVTTGRGANFKTIVMCNKEGLGWGADEGAQFSASGVDTERSFATVRYMKAGYAVGRKDEEKCHLILYADA